MRRLGTFGAAIVMLGVVVAAAGSPASAKDGAMTGP